MSDYTQEQIEQAKKEAQLLVDIYDSAHGQIFFCTDDGKKHDIGAIVKTILAALEATEKERDDAERARDDADIYAKAYAAKLEKSVNGVIRTANSLSLDADRLTSRKEERWSKTESVIW